MDQVNDNQEVVNSFGAEFRNYEDSVRQQIVESNYKNNHIKMTFDFVQSKHKQWLGFNHGEFTIKEVIDMLDELIDDSDPDIDLPNSIHDFQTAERIREKWPQYDWFHLTGLLHDLGKFMALKGDEQWSVVGDTFPVGCAFSEKCVMPIFFVENPDTKNPKYNTEYGIYEKNCGLDNLIMGWGHDEYMYQVLKNASCKIPEGGMACIRYHSFYPWHTSGAYKHLTNVEDEQKKLPWIKEFNKFDLYSKGDTIPDIEKLWEEYYYPLCIKYGLGGKLKW